MMNKNNSDSSDYSDDEYNEVSYEVSYEEDLSNETSDEIDEINDLIIDGNSYESSEEEDNEEINIVTLKNNMIFPKKSQVITKVPQIIAMPQLKGIMLPSDKRSVEGTKSLLPTQKPATEVLSNKNNKKYDSKEIDLILQNMPGINISDNPVNYQRENIDDLLQKESQESLKDFNIRKEITLKINNIKDPKIKNSTCVVIGLMITKKLRFGIKYEENIENLIKYILDVLKTK